MRKPFYTAFLCLALFAVSPNSPAYAQEDAAEDQAMQEQEDAAAQTPQEALAKAQAEALGERVKTVMKGLDQAALTHFSVMYTNYTVYSMVQAVRSDISEAVDACAENNPKMEKALQARFKQWEDSVGENLKEAKANIEAMGLAQDYVSQNDLNTVFALVDETRAANSSQFETSPVTTPEACEFMMSKMDETQNHMNMMLMTTLQSYPNVMKKTQQ